MSSKVPNYLMIDGLKMGNGSDVEFFRESVKYEPQDDDLFVVTYPKCGTTWTMAIVGLILNHGKYFEPADHVKRFSFLELWGSEPVKNLTRPGAIKTHLPYEYCPKSPKAKYIYIARNPKDACVSFYYHTRGQIEYEFQNGKFEDFFELFIDGEVDYGDYFDHVRGWWEHKNDLNMLFLTYEEMKADPKAAMIKIADFLGPSYGKELRENPEVLEGVIKNSEIEALRQRSKNWGPIVNDIWAAELAQPNPPRYVTYREELLAKFTRPQQQQKEDEYKHDHFRKGVVNDWKNEMTKEQAERLNKKFKERFNGTGIEELWNVEEWL